MDATHRVGFKTMIVKSLTSQVNCANDSFLPVSDSLELAVSLNLLKVKQYLSTCVCLPDKFHVSNSKCLPLCVCVLVYLCVSLFKCMLECFCVSLSMIRWSYTL